MSEQEYSLTLNDVSRFLATKQDDDELGICGHAKHCLLTETLNWLYPEQAPWRVDLGTYDYAGANPFDLGRKVLRLDLKLNTLRRAFDAVHNYAYPRKSLVTKRQLRAHLEYLESGAASPIDQIPFAVAELFPEQKNNA